jgi:cyclopropane fatty-acyl-phospholipid synthase-like methyltransferase
MQTREPIQLYYEEYHRSRAGHADLRRVQSNLRGFDIRPGDRIIDIGCGLGAAGLYITSMDAKPFGLDLSLEAVRASATRYAAV